MKKISINRNLAFIALGGMLLASACSDDKDAPVGKIPDKTFTSSTGLELYYNGAEMPGKSISFSQEGDKATITGFSSFDLSQLSSLGLSGTLPCPGIIPGSTETVWNVDLIPAGGKYIFSGKDSNEYCSYSYSGSVSADHMEISITDAVLSDHPLSVNAWKPAPIEKDNSGFYSSLPVYVDWQYDPIPDIDIDLSGILASVTTIPIIPVYNNTAYMSISQALEQVLKAVAFRQDGNILFTYISSTGGAASIAQTQPNGLFYTAPDQGAIQLYVNPLSLFGFILENTSGSTPPEDVDLTGTGLYPSGSSSSSASTSQIAELMKNPMVMAVAKALMQNLLPQIAEGIPLSYTVTGRNLDIFLDTPATLSILKTVIDTVMENDEALQAVLTELKKNEALAPLIEDLPKFQQVVEAAIARTTVLKIGFAFVPYS